MTYVCTEEGMTITTVIIGQVVSEEFGVTRNSNHRVYAKILIYYLTRIRAGMTKEQAIKECHEHYDPILAKDSSLWLTTADVARVVPNFNTCLSGKRTIEDLKTDIEW